MDSRRAGKTQSRPWLPLCLLLAIMAHGCAVNQTGGQPPTEKETPRAGQDLGFLSDYQRLRPAPGRGDAQSWRREGVDWGKYDKVLIERMLVFLEEGNRKGVDPTDLKMLVDYFHQALVKEVGKSSTMVDAPGPGVLRVRIAIVDMVSTSVAGSVAGTVVPYAFAAELASGAASGRPAGSTPYLGKTGIQAQFLDGATGQVVGEFADTEFGRKYVADLEQGVPNAAEKWANGYFQSFTTWGYAKEAFDLWAKWLRQGLDDLRSPKAAQ